MDTGLGKSRVALGVVKSLRVPALIVVPTEAIALQWIAEAGEMLPNMKIEQYVNARKKKAGPRTHDVVVVIINTLAKMEASFTEGYGLISVVDRAANSVRQNTGAFSGGYRGRGTLSASPPRRWTTRHELHRAQISGRRRVSTHYPRFRHIGRRFHRRGVVRRVHGAPRPECETGISAAGTTMAVKTIDNVNKDPHRMRMIVDAVVRLHKMHEGPEAKHHGLVADDDPGAAPPPWHFRVRRAQRAAPHVAESATREVRRRRDRGFRVDRRFRRR